MGEKADVHISYGHGTEKVVIPVVIALHSIQYLDGESSEQQSQKMCGEMRNTREAVYIIYEEMLEGLEQPVKTMLKLKRMYSSNFSEMTLLRRGDLQADMHFIPDRESSCHYRSPYGTVSFEIRTKKLSVQTADDGISLDIMLEYALMQADMLVSEHCLELSVRPNK